MPTCSFLFRAVRRNLRRLPTLGWVLVAWLCAGTLTARAHCCVWKVIDAAGHTLYLAGSIHMLRASDYPLPKPYDDALAASSGVSLEYPPDPSSKGATRWQDTFDRAAQLPKGVLLKDRVDPRTYAYILKVLRNVHGATDPEKRIEHLRPWALSWMLSVPGGLPGVSKAHGVEAYILPKARAGHKQLDGLVSLERHIATFGEMNDADSEAVLLLAFIHLNTEGKEYERMESSWKRGDLVGIEKSLDDDYRDVPSVRRRLLTDRNHIWMPKLEEYLRSGKTWMVVAGAGHMAGDQGVPALLAAQGYKVEQL